MLLKAREGQMDQRKSLNVNRTASSSHSCFANTHLLLSLSLQIRNASRVHEHQRQLQTDLRRSNHKIVQRVTPRMQRDLCLIRWASTANMR